MEKINNNSFKSIFSLLYIVVFFVLLFFQSAIMNINGLSDSIVSFVKPLEEVFLLLLVFSSIFIIDYYRVFKSYRIQISLLIFTLHLVASAFYNNIQLHIFLSSWILFIKGFLFYWIISLLKYNPNHIRFIINILLFCFVICSIIAFIQLLGVKILWIPSYRLHLNSIATTSIFNQHTLWATAVAVATCISLGLYYPKRKKRFFIMFIFFFISLILSTARRHLFAIPFAFFMVTFILEDGFEKYKKLFKISLVLTFIGLILLPWIITVIEGTIQEYIFQAETRDRFALYIGGYNLANESPLFGRGPGMFGSWPSQLFDSPVYKELGIEKIVKPEYMNGAPIAGYIGEFGWLGLAIILNLFYSLYRRIIFLVKNSKENYYVFQLGVIVLLLFFNGIIETIVHPYFTGSIATYIFFGLMGVLESSLYNKNKKYETTT